MSALAWILVGVIVFLFVLIWAISLGVAARRGDRYLYDDRPEDER